MQSRTLNALIRFLAFTMAIELFVMVGVMCSLVVTRYFFSFSPGWSEEVTRYLMVWMVMTGASVLTLYEDHITLYSFTRKFSVRVAHWHRVIVNLIIFAVSALAAFYGWRFIFQVGRSIAPGLQISMFWPTLAIPFGLTLSALAALANAIAQMRGHFEYPSLPIMKQSEVMDGSFRPLADDEEGAN